MHWDEAEHYRSTIGRIREQMHGCMHENVGYIFHKVSSSGLQGDVMMIYVVNTYRLLVKPQHCFNYFSNHLIFLED